MKHEKVSTNARRIVLLTFLLFFAVSLFPNIHLREVFASDTEIDYFNIGASVGTLQAVHPSSTSTISAMGQTFNATSYNYYVTSMKFSLAKVGSPVGNVVARLYDHTGTFGVDGLPTGSSLAESEAIAMASLATSETLYEFIFNDTNRYQLSINTAYCVVVLARDATTLDTSNWVQVYRDIAAGDDGNGFGWWSSAWGTSTRDYKFYVYGSAGSDTTAPQYQNIGYNDTHTSTTCLFSVNLTDNVALNGSIFGCNVTGSWQNETYYSLSGTQAWHNVTKTLPSTDYANVQFEWWFNDTSNNWNNTGVQSFYTKSLVAIIDELAEGQLSHWTTVRLASQSKTFYGYGLHWGFYVENNGTDEVAYYKTSTDGITWINKTELWYVGVGAYLDIYFDETYLHLAYRNTTDTYDYYVRGTPSTSGAISWGTHYLALGDGTHNTEDPFITLDANGYPWISGNLGDPQYISVTKSSTKDGTWTTASGFPLYVNTTFPNPFNSQLCPLDNGDMYVVYAVSTTNEALSTEVYARRWSHTSETWLVQEKISTTRVSGFFYQSYSSSSINGNVHVVFLENNTGSADCDIIHVWWNKTSELWSSETVVQADTSRRDLPFYAANDEDGSVPIIAHNTATNEVFCIWAGNPDANTIYYKKWNATDGTWSASPVSLKQQPSYRPITAWCSLSGSRAGNQYLAILYVANGSSWDVMYALMPSAPTNDACTITDFDDTNNIYAQRVFYTIVYDIHDTDGYTDINYAEVRFKQGTDTRAIFRYTEDTNTFSIESGSTYWSIDSGSCSATRVDTYINLTIKFSPHWDATEESDVDIECYVIDSLGADDTDTMQTDYFDVVTTLVTGTIECTDVDNPDRVSISGSVQIDFTVFYADDPSSSTPSSFYPPDAEFTSISVYNSTNNNQGTDNTIVNGAGSVVFNVPNSVGSDTYNLYVDMVDADYTDGELLTTETIITDRIVVYWEQANNSTTRVDVNENVVWGVEAVLDYDDHALGSGDSLSCLWGSLSWDAGSSTFNITHTSATATALSIGTWTGEEVTYSITAITENVTESVVIFDNIQVSFGASDTTPENDETVTFTVSMTRDYDGSPVTSYNYTIERDSLPFGNPHNSSTFTDSGASVTHVYNFTGVTDDTYDLSAFTDPADVSVTWATPSSGSSITAAQAMCVGIVMMIVGALLFLLIKEVHV